MKILRATAALLQLKHKLHPEYFPTITDHSVVNECCRDRIFLFMVEVDLQNVEVHAYLKKQSVESLNAFDRPLCLWT